MTSRSYRSSHLWLFFGCVTFVFALHLASAQQPSQQQVDPVVQSADKENDEAERRRMFRTFKNQRQSVASDRTKATSKRTTPAKSTSTSEAKAGEDAFVGFTVWEMRESANGTERRSFKLKKPNGQRVVLRPFRLGSDSQLVAGRSYVFSIESARDGYLYVIDRERSANGALGDPLLLFPTKDVRGGTNRITAGNVVEIPDQKTETAYFEATKNGQDHIGEALIIIVSTEPLVDASKLKDEPITLDPDEVAKWGRQWSTKTRWAENLEAIGRPYTEEEGQAGGDRSYKLTEGDPLPQRLYQLGSKASSPLFVTVLLRYSDAANPK